MQWYKGLSGLAIALTTVFTQAGCAEDMSRGVAAFRHDMYGVRQQAAGAVRDAVRLRACGDMTVTVGEPCDSRGRAGRGVLPAPRLTE